jgi:hypothetical protein
MKRQHIVFVIIFSLIVLLQAFYYLFANQSKPILFGMPFGMFVIVSLIFIEFIVLLILYYMDEIKPSKKRNI